MFRLFFALPLGADAERLLYKGVTQYRAYGKMPVRWVGKNSLHITIHFLGDVEETRVEKLREILLSVTSAYEAPRISFTGAGFFPKMENPRVFWMGVKDQGVLEEFTSQSGKQLLSEGFHIERGRFSPHVTLCRFSDRGESVVDPSRIKEMVNYFNTIPLPPFTGSEVNLYQSTLTGTGAVYSVLESGKFGKR